MSSQEFIKSITSKDINLSHKTIKTLINTCNINDFQQLCDKSDFIFPFLKDRIAKDFVKLVEEKDLKTIFEFSKIYCFDFEDLIVNSLVKFASEDLTDDILELFENGTNEQKAYCAKYFSLIQDPLALEYLKKEAKSDFEPLQINCAQTLKCFNDVEVLNDMKNIILNSLDDYEKLSAFNFIVSYGGDNQIKFAIDNAFNNSFCTNIISNILDFNQIDYLKNIVDEKNLVKILRLIIDEYPEDISLNTLLYWQIQDFMKLVYSFNNQYSKNLLLIAKKKFEEFSDNDIYLFDLDKNTKDEVKNILKYLKSLKLDFKFEDYNENDEFDLMLDVISSYNLVQYSEKLAQIFNEKQIKIEHRAKIAQNLKTLNKIELIDKNIVEKIENEDIKSFIKSLF